MRRLAMLVVLASLVTSCSIREDAAPRDIPVEQRGNFGEIATGQAAVGGGRIYLLGPVDGDEQAQLRAVQREEASSPADLLNSLLDGANEDENSIGLSTAIPADLVIDQARTVGTRLTIDINDAFNELSDLGLRQAIAQIVATASEIDQVQQIRIRVNGENQGWPTGDGEVTDRPLSIYDYPGFLETSPPAFPALPSA
jgi:spore germination protein GerM